MGEHSVFVVTPYTAHDVEDGIDAKFTLSGGGYSTTLQLSEHANHVTDYFGADYIELEFEYVLDTHHYTLEMESEQEGTHTVFENVPFANLVDESFLEER